MYEARLANKFPYAPANNKNTTKWVCITNMYLVATVYRNIYAKFYTKLSYCNCIAIEKRWHYLSVVSPNAKYIQ